MSQSTDVETLVLGGGNRDEKIRTLAQAQSAATDWYVKVKLHNNTDWRLKPYKRILAAEGWIEQEPQSVSKKSEGSGRKYDAPFGPDGVSVLISYDSPDPNWKFAWCFAMPYIGSNSCHAKIVSKDINTDQKLFNSRDRSTVTANSQSNMTVDGKQFTFTISCSIGGGTTPTADFYVNFASA